MIYRSRLAALTLGASAVAALACGMGACSSHNENGATTGGNTHPEEDGGVDSGADASPPPLDCTARPQAEAAIQVMHHDGQTFVVWTDKAQGAAGLAFHYDVYRSEQPITQGNIAQAERIAVGVLDNSAKLFGEAFNEADRLDPTKPMTVLEEMGTPLPYGSGLQVYTAKKDVCAYYAIVTTSADGAPIEGEMVATTVAVAERVAPLKPIKVYDSHDRVGGSYVTISGTPNLPLRVLLHASQGGGGPAGKVGDGFLYYGDTSMGYRDGLPGVYSVYEYHPELSGPSEPHELNLYGRDTIVAPTGKAKETFWFGYAAVPDWAPESPPRAYPFTEQRLAWIIDQAITRYSVDREHVTCAGGSMGGWGTLAFGVHHPELFAAIYPDRPKIRQTVLPSLVDLLPNTTLMNDGVTPYVERMDFVKYVTEHKEDLPFIVWGVGRKDGFDKWADDVEFVKAMTDSHHGFAFQWDNENHGSQVVTKVAAAYPAAKFALHQSYPAFGHSSIDSKLGNGDPADGDLEGGINLGFDWNVTDDSKGKWAASVSNSLPTSMMTADVTPRRCQAFKPVAGTTVNYTTSNGQSGTVPVDADGLVTVPAVKIAPGVSTVVTLTQ